MTGYIYRIYVKPTGKSYVGQTTQDPDFVWGQAKSKLRLGKHPCKPLQEHVNEYGIGNTHFQVLEEALEELLPEAQKYWMSQFDCFNSKVIKAPRKSRNGRSVIWNGVTYPSLRAASEATGLSMKQLHDRLDAGYERDGEMVVHPFKVESFPTQWDGKEYPSIKAASDAANIPYAKMKRYRLLHLTTAEEVQAYEAMSKEKQRQESERRRLETLQQQYQDQQKRLATLRENIMALL